MDEYLVQAGGNNNRAYFPGGPTRAEGEKGKEAAYKPRMFSLEQRNYDTPLARELREAYDIAASLKGLYEPKHIGASPCVTPPVNTRPKGAAATTLDLLLRVLTKP